MFVILQKGFTKKGKIMINGISFTGRETMLTKPVEKVVSKSLMNMYHQAKYFHLRKIFFNATAKVMLKNVLTDYTNIHQRQQVKFIHKQSVKI